MIEINLIPEELRNKVVKLAKSEASKAGLNPMPQQLILIIPLVFSLLIIAHIILAFLGITRSAQLSVLKGKWERSALVSKALEDFNTEYTLLSGDSQAVQKLLSERIDWAEKLNKLSLIVPAGIWFDALSASGKEFSLYGKVVSLNKEEVSLIRQLIDALKNDAIFFKDFSTLELSSVQKATLGGYEIADFTLIGALKGNGEVNRKDK